MSSLLYEKLSDNLDLDELTTTEIKRLCLEAPKYVKTLSDSIKVDSKVINFEDLEFTICEHKNTKMKDFIKHVRIKYELEDVDRRTITGVGATAFILMKYCSNLGKSLENSSIQDGLDVSVKFTINNYRDLNIPKEFPLNLRLNNQHNNFTDLFKNCCSNEKIEQYVKSLFNEANHFNLIKMADLKEHLKDIVYFNNILDNLNGYVIERIGEDEFETYCKDEFKQYDKYSLTDYFNKIDFEDTKLEFNHFFIDCKKINIQTCQQLHSDFSLKCVEAKSDSKNAEVLVVPKKQLLAVLKVLDQNNASYEMFLSKQNLLDNVAMSKDEIIVESQKVSQSDYVLEQEKLSDFKVKYPNLTPLNTVNEDKRSDVSIENVRTYLTKDKFPNERIYVRKSSISKNACEAVVGNPYLVEDVNKALEIFNKDLNSDFQKVFGTVQCEAHYDIVALKKILELNDSSKGTFDFVPDYLLVKPEPNLNGGLELVKELCDYKNVIKINGNKLFSVPKEFFDNSFSKQNLLLREGILNSKIFERISDAISDKNELRREAKLDLLKIEQREDRNLGIKR